MRLHEFQGPLLKLWPVYSKALSKGTFASCSNHCMNRLCSSFRTSTVVMSDQVSIPQANCWIFLEPELPPTGTMHAVYSAKDYRTSSTEASASFETKLKTFLFHSCIWTLIDLDLPLMDQSVLNGLPDVWHFRVIILKAYYSITLQYIFRIFRTHPPTLPRICKYKPNFGPETTTTKDKTA